jgi:low affinity Fe/Cu permease
MNTISRVVTFLIQNPPNRVSAALQMKLDELFRVTAARERLARIERLSESELSVVREEIEKDGE